MLVKDKNQTLQEPEGFALEDVQAVGSYLRLAYWLDKYRSQEGCWEYCTVVVYLNDQGREVLRTTDWRKEPHVAQKFPPIPVPRWIQFQNGFSLALEGLKEMTKCLRKS